MADGMDARDAWLQCLGSEISSKVIDRVVDASSRVRLGARETLVDQKDEGGNVFLLTSGCLKAVRYSERGHEIWLSEFNPGDLVGEIASLTNRQRSSALVAMEKSELLAIPEKDFRSLMKTQADFASSIARIVAQRLVDTSKRLAELMVDPVVMRLYSELIRLGSPIDGDEERLALPKGYSITRIGDRIHATREATSRALSTLEDRGMALRTADSIIIVFVPKDRDAFVD